MSAGASRKRGRSPTAQLDPTQKAQPMFSSTLGVEDPSHLSNDQFIVWGSSAPSSTYPANSTSFGTNQSAQVSQQNEDAQAVESSPLNQMVRRNRNTDLTRQGNRDGTPSQDAWSEPVNSLAKTWEEAEDGDDLDNRAATAKKDAQSKRPPKQIPPFIQKLRSFLDQDSNTDLIRWSDDGNSFVVLDEDRFANRLIPEMFKHKNYTSFVRQLNMYGFHKLVGLADNSMRASERKARSPSEYSNPYFKRGRPELMWLIQKPKNVTKANLGGKSKLNGQLQDSDEEENDGAVERAPEGQLQKPNMDVSTVSQPAFNSLQKEVAQLQRSQQQITSMLSRLRDENNQYIRQASTMVAQHERHENSINAILTFLATFYNRSLEGQDNLPNMFANAFAGNNQFPTNQHQGNVVDVGDFDDTTFNHNTHQFEMSRQSRRPLALLPAPVPDSKPSMQERSSTPTAEHLQIPKPPRPSFQSNGKLRNSPLSEQSSPAPAAPSPGDTSINTPIINNQNDDIMSVIRNANANAQHNRTKSTTNPDLDFGSALKHYQHADGQAPLTDEQRHAMLSMMANNSGTTTPNAFGSGINVSNPYQSPLDYFNGNRDHLDMLARLQEEQDFKMQHLADRLQPLSPSGSIPGFAFSPSSGGLSPSGSGNAQQQPNNGSANDFDINAFLNDLSAVADEGSIADQQQDGHNQHARGDDINSYFPSMDGPNDFSIGEVDFDNLTGDENFDATPVTSGTAEQGPSNVDSPSNDNNSLITSNDFTARPSNPTTVIPTAAEYSARKLSTGKLVGSTGTNSAAATPSVESASDTDDDARGGSDLKLGRKRRKLER